jgi:arylsulfatase
LDLLPTFVGMTGVPEASRSVEVKALPGHDFSSLLADPEKAGVHAVRAGVLFNYLGLASVDGDYLTKIMSSLATRQPPPPLSAAKLDKRGFLSFVFDGRYKFARFYAPTAFNTPQTVEEIFKSNDVQLFDLEKDSDEVLNLALAPEKNKELILRMNGLLNDLIAREVGANDGRFLLPLLSSR